MGIINYYPGCGSDPGCMGPDNPFYTIFNTELRIIYYPLILALIPLVIAFVILLFLKKKSIIVWSNKRIMIILGIVYLLSFIWFANWTYIVY